MHQPPEAGLVDVLDGYVHAVRPGLRSRSSLCGSGPIVVALAGGYDPGDALACPRCTQRLETEVAEAPDGADRADRADRIA